MKELQVKRRNALSGKADSMVTLLHGLGANADDMIGLSNLLEKNLPNTKFIAPEAPHRSAVHEDGRQWFSMPSIDGTTHVELGMTLQESIDRLVLTIETEAEGASIEPDRRVLMGFSQGAMIAMHIAPRLVPQICCVVAFSGMLMESNSLSYELRSKPPVMLCHDTEDDTIDFKLMEQTRKSLADHDIRVYTHESTGAGHSVHPTSLGCALHFIERELDSARG